MKSDADGDLKSFVEKNKRCTFVGLKDLRSPYSNLFSSWVNHQIILSRQSHIKTARLYPNWPNYSSHTWY